MSIAGYSPYTSRFDSWVFYFTNDLGYFQQYTTTPWYRKKKEKQKFYIDFKKDKYSHTVKEKCKYRKVKQKCRTDKSTPFTTLLTVIEED